MDLLERINDTLPDHIWSDEDNTAARMEALADRHAVGFAEFLMHKCERHYPGYIYEDGLYSIKSVLSIYKRRYPDGY